MQSLIDSFNDRIDDIFINFTALEKEIIKSDFGNFPEAKKKLLFKLYSVKDLNDDKKTVSRWNCENFTCCIPDVCAICMSDIETNEKSVVTSCNHIFHTACLKSWMKFDATCPQCRYKLINKS